ncbi:MAG: glycosyltransferase [Saccharofermentans sp.]|nr:glycosyltransferase [Saccharofermentans sp.]
MTSPVVSICLPIYNGARFLKIAIESVLNQTYSNFELIICDDCSSDNSPEIVEKYNDSRIKFYKNEKNLGLVGNWNNSFSYATGKYIKLMMQDDYLYPNAIAKQVELLELYPQASLCIGNTSVINENGDVVCNRNRFNKDGVIDGRMFAKKALRGRNLFCEPPNVMFRKETVNRVGEFDNSFTYAPDWDFCISISSIGDVAYTNDKVMDFRISDISETNRVLNQNAGASTLGDCDRMFLKHYNAKIIPLNAIDYAIFKTTVRLLALARVIVLRIRKKR